MSDTLDQTTAGYCGRIKNRFAEFRIDSSDHEAHNGTRRIKLSRIAGCIAHFLKHRFVEASQNVNFFAGSKMNRIDLVNDIPQKVAINHSVNSPFEYRR